MENSQRQPGPPSRPASSARTSEPVTREQLYETVWAEPMLRIAERFGVSSSYMSRVCTELQVPRPPRGYWAQLEVGRAPERPVLPPVRPGDPVEWTVGSSIGTRLSRTVATRRNGSPVAAARPRTTKAEAVHELLASAKPLFLKSRKVREDGLLRPFKRLLPDIVASEAALDDALDLANRLFLALERRGHRVTFAPPNSGMRRTELDVRASPTKNGYHDIPWSPDRPTVVYVSGMAIGLTLFELTERVEVVYVKGDYLPVRDLSVEQLRRYREPYHWRSHRDLASRRLCLRAYSTFWRVDWSREWREAEAGQLSALMPQVFEELERAAPELGTLVSEAKARAEAERVAWEARRQREREEAERARLAKNQIDARSDLLRAIAAWDESERIRSYLAAAQSAVLAIPDGERSVMAERLQKARALLGTADPLSVLLQWRAPDER